MLKNYKHLKCPGAYINEAYLKLPHRAAKSAHVFRRAIHHQEVALKKQLTPALGTNCFSLDHHPVPFSALKRIFLKQQGLNPDISPYEALTIELLRDWQHFHGSLAEYRVVDIQFNLFINRRYSDYWLDIDRRIYFMGAY